MSELAASAPPVDTTSAGTLLRAAREAAGLHVAALAVSLKVPVGKLEALEGDRYDLLPDAVFTRALASSVCRALKIDPQPVLERLPRGAAPRLVHDSDGINAPFRAPGDGPKPGWAEQLTRPVALTVGGLLLAALVLVLLPDRQAPEPAAAPKPEPVMPPGAPTTVALPPADATAPAARHEAASAAPVAEPAPTAPKVAASAPVAAVAGSPAPVAAPTPAVAASTPAMPTAPGAAASQAAAAPAAPGLVMFRTRARSWIEVVDARGQTVLRRLMEGGEAASATGALPLSVTVGSVGATEVQVRGRPFDLGPVSRDNVARFEVK